MLSELSKRIEPSSTLAITAKAKQLKAEGKKVIGFGAGEPDFDTPDYIKQAAIEALKRGETKYTPAAGTLQLKKAIVQKFRKENNLTYGTDQITVNCGAKHSLFNIILCTVGPGDEVIIPSPYWVSYTEMVKAAGATPVIADCITRGTLKLTPGILSGRITERTKLLILNSPSNPTGVLYTREELEALGKIVLQHDFLVISDEIYEHLVYDGVFTSIAQISDELKERTIIVNGVSKAYSMTGWRIGYAAGDKQVIAACGKLQSHSTSNPTTFAQSGAVAALTSEEGPAAIERMRIEFGKRRDFVYNELSSISDLSVPRPEGAFYIFPNIERYLSDKVKSSFDFAEKILSEKLVALVPGEGFGAPGYVRISYATSMDDLAEGIGRFKAFLKEIKPA
ncbi:MAG: pyridoxal phosphate-dependent aminotransferase [Elusimicrobia bacterium]|nr:pyridoxal phosphate-dependent aminotransferase [Elusimicrobiota bacterium]